MGRDAEESSQNESKFVEFGRLPRLNPTAGTGHAGNAQVRGVRIHEADELFDPLRLVAGGLDDRRPFDESSHEVRRGLS